jgi:signal transduction histidine kinase
MKRLSIKANITLWYTGLLVIFLALVMLFVLYLSDNLMLSKVKSALVDIVVYNAEEIGAIDGKPDLGDLERYDNGVNILVHSLNGDLIFGRYPAGFPEKTALTSGVIQTISTDDKQWYVYDYLVTSPQHEGVMVRGISSMDIVTETINIATLSAIFIFPLLLILAAFGGYRITKRAFRPVRKIADAAAKINGGDDLSKRIGLMGSRDEIASLAETFDGMFDRLQKSFERERQFTADASHELRTPTAVIMSQCEYAISEIDHKEEVQDSLNIILRQSQKMAGLISQLLLLTHTENPENKLAFEVFDFSELAEIVVGEMTLSAKAAGVDLIKEIEPAVVIEADHALMARLLINLISNGIKYGKADGFVMLKVSIDGSHLIGSVSDNGIGIGEEHLDRVWDRFYQVNPSRTSDNTDSMGFGLSMVQWIVEAHHGTITVQSTLGEGSTFMFRLPLSQ